MKIRIESEEELLRITKRFLHISANLRHFTKEWNEHYGGVLLAKKKKWEKEMDDFLEELGVSERESFICNVHVSIKENE